MHEKPQITFLLLNRPEDGDFARALQSLLPWRDRIQLTVLTESTALSPFAHVHILPEPAPQGWADFINRSWPSARGEYLGVIAPGVELLPHALDLIRQEGERYPQENYFYGDYREKDSAGHERLIESNCAPLDITEREDWGPLELYRTEALRRIGGADAHRHFRPDYDLRLRLTDNHSAVHITHPLCSIIRQPPEASDQAQALFFPGRGRFGGFSYLFMDPAEEKEIEDIFYQTLQRRGAFLTSPPGGRFSAPSNASPRVSVIIPVHNRAAFLPLAVASVQKGSFQDFEIIIVDNASTDMTLRAAQDLASSDPRIRVFSLPDNIIAKALNQGVRLARGEYIAQLDSDDEYAPATLAAMVAHLDQNLNQGLAISYYELMNESGQTLEEFGVIKHLEYNRNNILRVDGAGAVRVWRKAAMLEFGVFNEQDFGHYGEDYDLVLKVGEKYEVGRVHQVLYRYRRHPGNSDVLRPQSLKIKNKTLARARALERRQKLNRSRTL